VRKHAMQEVNLASIAKLNGRNRKGISTDEKEEEKPGPMSHRRGGGKNITWGSEKGGQVSAIEGGGGGRGHRGEYQGCKGKKKPKHKEGGKEGVLRG